MEATLYSMGLSHPARTVGLMLEHKGVDYRRVDIPTGLQPVALRAAGFRGPTVPALKADGRRVQGSLQISRFLEDTVPEPALFPADAEARRAVEEAESWGEGVYQAVPRRIFRWLTTRDSDLRTWLARDAKIPAAPLAGALSLPVTFYFARAAGADDDQIRRDLAELPAHLDHVDGLIAQGVIGGSDLNAADFQIATTTRTILNMPPLRKAAAGRPAEAHANRVAGDFGSEIPLTLPPGWAVGA